uniref:Uncharacterized protein n=1 Tax=Panagrolaimus sp. ES5 TaxID=591445 RepID=A0AC34GT47_9BILA
MHFNDANSRSPLNRSTPIMMNGHHHFLAMNNVSQASFEQQMSNIIGLSVPPITALTTTQTSTLSPIIDPGTITPTSATTLINKPLTTTTPKDKLSISPTSGNSNSSTTSNGTISSAELANFTMINNLNNSNRTKDRAK